MADRPARKWVPGSSGVIRWRRDDPGYVGDEYEVKLLAPYRWEVSFRQTPIGFSPSRKAAVTLAEGHRLDTMRRTDLWLWAIVMLAALGTMAAVGTAQRGNVGYFVIFVLAMYAGVSAFVRFFAALTRNRRDPYRHRLWFERRARWWDPLGTSLLRWWRYRMAPQAELRAAPLVRPLPPSGYTDPSK